MSFSDSKITFCEFIINFSILISHVVRHNTRNSIVFTIREYKYM